MSIVHPTNDQVDAASKAFRFYGIDFPLPWEGDLDDEEFERFKALKYALTAALNLNSKIEPIGKEPTK